MFGDTQVLKEELAAGLLLSYGRAMPRGARDRHVFSLTSSLSVTWGRSSESCRSTEPRLGEVSRKHPSPSVPQSFSLYLSFSLYRHLYVSAREGAEE